MDTLSKHERSTTALSLQKSQASVSYSYRSFMFVQPKRQRTRGVVIFTLIYQILFASIAIARSDYPALFQVVSLLVFSCVIFFAHKRLYYHINLLWFLSLWGALHLAGSIVVIPESWVINENPTKLHHLAMAGNWLEYIHLEYFYGFFLITWVCWQTLCSIILVRYQRRLMPTFGLLLLCGTSSLGCGAINLFIENIAQLLMLHSEGTIHHSIEWELAAGVAGAFSASLCIKLRNL